MGWQIVHDQESQTAMLVDPSGPWALGPCLVGPTAADVLAAYVDGLGQDPAELTAWEQVTTWTQFLAMMGEVSQDDRVEVVEPPGATPPPPGDPAAGLPVAGAERPGESTAVLEAGRDEPPAPAPAERESWPPCPNCGSDKREAKPDGSTACAICGEPLG